MEDMSEREYQPLGSVTDVDDHTKHSTSLVGNSSNVETNLPDQLYQLSSLELEQNNHAYSAIVDQVPRPIEHRANVATESVVLDHIDQPLRSEMDRTYLEILNPLPDEQIVSGEQEYIPMTFQASNQEERNTCAKISEYSYRVPIGQSSSLAEQGENVGTDGNEYAYITTNEEPSERIDQHQTLDSGDDEHSYITPISYPLSEENQRRQNQNNGLKTSKILVVVLLGVFIAVMGVTFVLGYFLGRGITTELVNPTMIPQTDIATESANPNIGQTTELSTVLSDAALAGQNTTTVEFVVSFPKPFYLSFAVRLMIYSSQKGFLQVKNIYENKVLKEGKNIIDLSRGVSLDNLDEKQNKTLRIISSVMIGFSVVTIIHNNHVSWYEDGSYIIPKRYLSKQYIIPTFTTWHSFDRSLIGISSFDTPTQVNITIRTTQGSILFNRQKYNDGKFIELYLGPYESLQLSHDFDLSGTTITAMTPIAVMAGNRCGRVKSSMLYCSYFIENILPVDQQDTEFIVPIIQNRPASVVRVYSYYQNKVSIFSDNSVIRKVIEPEGWDQFLHNNVSYITATSNLLVMIYPNETIHPYLSFMMTIHGKKQYKPTYFFIVPNKGKEDDSFYLSFSFYGNDANGFEMDEKPLIVSSVTTKTIEGKMISTFGHEVAPGAHRVTNTNRHSFGLWVYGNIAGGGYGLPAGIHFN